MRYRSVILKGVTGALTVFLFGFAVMYLLWNVIGNPNNLPGLFYYRAATIGDGICLPILVGSAIAFLQLKKDCMINQKNDRWIFILVIVSLIIAIFIQASWLLRDDTVLNWSIPIQHHFNVAGWYHSLFFVGMFGTVTYLFGCIWKVLNKENQESGQMEYALFMLFSFASSLFFLMHITDDYKKYFSMERLVCICVVLTYGLLGIFMWSANHKLSRKIWAAMVMGVESAYCIALFICIPTQGDIVLAIGGGLCACFLWRVQNYTFLQMLLQDFWTIPVHMCIIYVLTGMTSIRAQIIICIPFIIMIVINEYLHNGKMEWRFFSIGLMAVYPILSNMLVIVKNITDAKNILFSFSVVLLFKKEIRIYFEDLMKAENDKNMNKINETKFLDIKKKVYLQIVLGIVSVLLVLAHWIYDLAEDNQYKMNTGDIQFPWWNIVLIISLIGMLVIAGMKNLRKYDLSKKLSVLISSALFLIAIFLIWNNKGSYSPITWNLIEWILFLSSMCACIGSSLLLAHGYFMNMLLLRGETKNIFIGVTANLLFVESLIFNLSVVVLMLCQHTWKSLLLIGGLEVILFILVPVLLARIQQLAWKDHRVKGNTPIGGIAQDGLMVTILMLLGVGLPCMYVQMINTNSWAEWVTGAGLICSAFMPIGFCLKNNVEHMKRQKKEYEKYPEEKEMWKALHKCLVRQSKQTVFAMLPYVCIAVGGCVIKRCLQSMEMRKILPDIYSTYIDGEKYPELKKEA